MTIVVRFRAENGDYAIPVERVSEVRAATGLMPLPAPRAGVAGLMRRGDAALPVLATLDAAGRHVVIIDNGALSFGLLVGEVIGVQVVVDALVGAAPPGQGSPIGLGVIKDGPALTLLLDVDALAGQLSP